jgi:hypothetical protein
LAILFTAQAVIQASAYLVSKAVQSLLKQHLELSRKFPASD